MNTKNENMVLFKAIQDFQNGDGNKMIDIYERTKKYAYQLICQYVSGFKSQNIYTGDVYVLAEDIMQELYLCFFQNIAKFKNDNPKSIYKWISVVSYRMVLAVINKNKMEVLAFEKDEDFREDDTISVVEYDRTLLPEYALEDKELQKVVMEFIKTIPAVQAQTILLHFVGGLKYREIAEEMKVSLITVKTRIKKATDSLAQMINAYEGLTIVNSFMYNIFNN